MDVRLPDGTIIRNIPDGTTKAQLLDKLKANGYDVSGFGGEPEPAPAWSDVPMQAIKNIPGSAWEMAKNIGTAVANPIDTAGAVMDVAAGGLQNAIRYVAPDVANAIERVDAYLGASENNKRINQRADAVGQFFADRYGSEEGLRRTIAEDPVGLLGDAATVLTAGGAAAARAPGVAGRIGEIAKNTGVAIDPVMLAGRGAANVGSLAGRVAAPTLGITTGTSGDSIAAAYQAGRESNPAFRAGMRGDLTGENVVGMAREAVDAMRQERGRNYNANMAATQANGTVLNFNPLQNALTTARDRYALAHGVVKNQEAADILGRMEAKIGEWQSIQPVPVTLPNGTTVLSFPHRTPAGFDQLKQALGEIRNETRQGSRARAAADEIYNSVLGEINRVDPNYARAMEEYAAASADLDEVTRTFSLGERASNDTAARKLQSVMRNNVNTNYGERTRLMDDLARYQPDLPYALAGQQLSSWEPRGLARFGAGLSVLGMLADPTMLATLGFTSPRLMGEGAYLLGGAANRVNRGLSSIPPSAYQLTQQAGRVQGLLEEEERQ